MKRLFILVAMAAVCGCAPKVTVTVENTLGIDRSAQLVEIPVEKLSSIALGFDDTYMVKNSAGDVVPSQWTYDGLLVFQSGLGANETATFTVSAGAPQEFAPKATGRYAPERFGDFIWENDRVAFRIYGEPLIAKDGPSNGIDALYKRAEVPVLDKWYEDYFSEAQLSYHDDHGTGLDDYNVKRTLGAGAAAPYVDGVLVLNSNFTDYELLDGGPLRVAFRLTYPDLAIGGVPVAETRTFALDAGSQLTRVVQEFGVSEQMTVAVGYPLREGPKSPYAADGNTFIISEPATAKASGIYLGAVLPSAIGEGQVVENVTEVPKGEKGAGTFHSVLALATYTPGVPFEYYTGYGWEKWGDWTAEKFAAYLADFDASLATPFVVTVK